MFQFVDAQWVKFLLGHITYLNFNRREKMYTQILD